MYPKLETLIIVVDGTFPKPKMMVSKFLIIWISGMFYYHALKFFLLKKVIRNRHFKNTKGRYKDNITP